MTEPNEPNSLAMDPEAFDAWLVDMPPAVQVVALRFPPDCYRDPTRKATHYALMSYNEQPGRGGDVTLSLIHGADSALPGVTVFGVVPQTLVRCGCGKWRCATEPQLEAMREHFAALERARALAPKD